MTQHESPVMIDGDFAVTFQYTAGIGGEAFCKGLKDGKFVGSKCPECAFVYVPARSFCEECFCEIANAVEVGPDGELLSFTKVDGQWVGAVLLRGASSWMPHRLKVKSDGPQFGDNVRAVFVPKSKRRGSINDIEYFEMK